MVSITVEDLEQIDNLIEQQGLGTPPSKMDIVGNTLFIYDQDDKIILIMPLVVYNQIEDSFDNE